MNIIAPGKLILSGEHAVVYGFPVLAMAINQHVNLVMQPQDSAYISLFLKDLAYECDTTLKTLCTMKERIKQDYQRFLLGQLPIRAVLKNPGELMQFAMGLLLGPQRNILDGIKVQMSSTIPIGCGMGSSAAAIVATIYGLAQHLGLAIDLEHFFQLGLEAENVQHGHSSGIDLYMSLHGGCFFKDDIFHASQLPNFPFYLVNTGAPQTTTGECIGATKEIFQTSSIGEEFSAVTRMASVALQSFPQNKANFMMAIRENHRLLIKIGVVPEPIMQFIAEVEAIGGAAKVCGAGSLTGHAAGAVLVLVDDRIAFNAIIKKYQYATVPVQSDARGVHAI